MKIVIFAGGVGTRLWPVSRKNTPKQFEKIIGDKSTLQQTVERLYPDFSPEDIYIATGKRYEQTVREQLPQLPSDNFIFEPDMRDVGPAIGLVASLLESKFKDTPIAILWSDHLVKNIDEFKKTLRIAEGMVDSNRADFVFIAQKPRYANQNIGWIELGNMVEEVNHSSVYEFKRLKYRPKLEDAESFFQNKKYVWNLGYFVTKPSYLVNLYERFAPHIYEPLTQVRKAWGTDQFESILSKVYPTLEKISFDDAILEKLDPSKMYVISSDLGWSDVGAWEALKEALAENADENVTKGNVMLEESTDNLVFSYNNQFVVGIDLKELLVINTHDVLLICPKTSVPKIKKLVESLAGTPNEHLT